MCYGVLGRSSVGCAVRAHDAGGGRGRGGVDTEPGGTFPRHLQVFV